MSKLNSQNAPVPSAATAAVLAWLMPGLGHWWIGERARAVILFVFITVTFWGGVAVGGVRSVVHQRDNGPWIAAQLCMGPQGGIALMTSMNLQKQERADHTGKTSFKAPWPSGDIGVIYAGVAGLLNLLVILDVLARVEYRQLTARSRSPAGKGKARAVS